MKFIVDENVGKLAKWLRLMGYDTRLFSGEDDGQMVNIALSENRIMFTRDRQVLRRRPVATGRLKAVLIEDDRPLTQLKQVVTKLGLDTRRQPFTICLECNQPLATRQRDEVKDLVPPYVYQTQTQYMQCPNCRRVFWRGSHWQAMTRQLASITEAGK